MITQKYHSNGQTFRIETSVSVGIMNTKIICESCEKVLFEYTSPAVESGDIGNLPTSHECEVTIDQGFVNRVMSPALSSNKPKKIKPIIINLDDEYGMSTEEAIYKLEDKLDEIIAVINRNPQLFKTHKDD